MFGIEHCKGPSVVGRETCGAPDLKSALANATPRARERGADNMRVSDATGRLIGTFALETPHI